MNVIFSVLFLVCTCYFLIFSPQSFLSVLSVGAEKAVTLSISLLAIYAVWLGFMQLLEECKLTDGLAKILKPLIKRLFKTNDEESIKYLSMNLSSNALGVSGAATPFGIKAAKSLEGGTHVRFSHSMLFVINATSVQLLPTTVLTLMSSYGAKNAYSIILPSLICTTFTTALGILLVMLFLKRR